MGQRGGNSTSPGRPSRPQGSSVVRRLRLDIDVRPFLVLFELTRACDLACAHCRADSVSGRDPFELSTDEVASVLDDLANLGAPRPRVVFTGGDPLRRPDLLTLVARAARGGLSVAVSPAGTPRANPAALAALRLAGASAVSFSVDGPTADVHDGRRGVRGSFRWTLEGCAAAAGAGLRLQVNTTVGRDNVSFLPAIARLVDGLGAGMWSVFLLVPTGRAQLANALGARETEDVLELLADLAQWMPVKTTEAPSFRRLLVQRSAGTHREPPGPLYKELHRGLAEAWPERGWMSTASHTGIGEAGCAQPSGRHRAPLAVGDGRGVVFVSCVGEVQPSGFLPVSVGNVRDRPLSELYATAPLLRALRDPAARSGRCGCCELGEICGGSRAQAYARSGDPLGEDPTCLYEPAVVAVWPRL
jgi:radical SAM protein